MRAVMLAGDEEGEGDETQLAALGNGDLPF